jgi:hypothetical protein
MDAVEIDPSLVAAGRQRHLAAGRNKSLIGAAGRTGAVVPEHAGPELR